MARPVGWILKEDDRERLLAAFPPRYSKVIAHHVTHWGRSGKPTAPPSPASFKVVGHADDKRGIEALVVSVDGDCDRPDGSIYHVTWSLDPASGCKPVDSNRLIKEAGWTETHMPHPFEAEPGWL
ncbi:hypothetical protein [Sphingomicrobium lutaoense]|uniref:Uncharacterized protein n=1 Tax=Sphingomicrobium lutaoense TaxID=515949 RepID=A0A839YYB6_9SPHN|nr:hypothetical protein [Sphingomicrobium lutaoense]MBB3764139.1 hypothetical protein [Sphingomicrobium lutaoense]